MRGILRQTVPSMFHRRLLLLAAVAVGVVALLGTQTARLTTGQQFETRRASVEAALKRTDLTPTVRGRILDRKGRVLAEDKPGVDVLVNFRVMNGDWAFNRAVDAARRDLGRERWAALDAVQREAVVYEYIAPYERQAETLWAVLADLGRLDPGEITARRDRAVRWVQRLSAEATRARQAKRINALRDESQTVGWADNYVTVAEELQPHIILTDVTDDVRNRIAYFIAQANRERESFDRRRALDPATPDDREYQVWLEVFPEHVKQRRYPWESRTLVVDRSTLPGPLRSDAPVELKVNGIGRHVLGALRRIHDGDRQWHDQPYYVTDGDGNVVTTDLAGYYDGDPIGAFGVERSMEPVLRGTRGQRIHHLDTASDEVIRPAPGTDVHLTLDIQLQARLQAIMSHDPRVGLMRSQLWHHAGTKPTNPQPGDPLNGAAIVLSIDNGEVLAAASVPGFSLLDLENDSVEVYGDHVNAPYRFRPISGYQDLYEPGSTNKPLVLAAAITDGVLGPDELLDTSLGRLWEDRPRNYRDWIVKAGGQPFGPIDGVEALKVSSNVFFGLIAQRYGLTRGMGFNRLAWWFSQFGFGRRLGVGLYEEVAGTIPPLDQPLSEADAAYMAIGEGALGTTPLQVVNAHATLARGGVFIPPTFIQDRSRPDGQRRSHDLHLSAAARERALRGMWESAHALTGTTRAIRFGPTTELNFTVPGVRVYAKSGTAEPPPLRRPHPDGSYDPSGEVIRTGNHAWVVALLQPKGESSPTIAVAVVAEFAGSGGRVCGPFVNQIAYALKAEGYLGGPDAP